MGVFSFTCSKRFLRSIFCYHFLKIELSCHWSWCSRRRTFIKEGLVLHSYKIIMAIFFFHNLLWSLIYMSFLAEFLADGWFIGGVYSKGSWKWTDGTPMIYQNFAAVDSRSYSPLAQDVTNYAFIKEDDYKWGYVSPFGTQRMGYICESTDCMTIVCLRINLFKATLHLWLIVL